MRFVFRALSVAVLAAAASRGLPAQDPAPAPPAPEPTPPPAETIEAAPLPGTAPAPVTTVAPDATVAPLGSPAPPPPPPLPAARIVDTPSVSIAKLPAGNPYGLAFDTPAALPPKLVFTDAALTAAFFVSVRVDPAGKALSVRRDRDPIPSLAGESMRSIQRWTITPARRTGQAVETWGAYRLELAVEIDSPKVTQAQLTPVTPPTPLPAPFAWPPEAEWLDTRKPGPTPEGTVSILEVDVPPMPQKTPWSADSFKGPFSVKFWIKVDKNGRIERSIPLEVSDPVLLAYFRKAMSSWVLRPAQSKGAPVESWNELTLSGTISFDDDVKQVTALRRSIGP
jgi:hypothetical protein